MKIEPASADVRQRLAPKIWHHDWYTLTKLREAIQAVTTAHAVPAHDEVVVDLGCGEQPYRRLFAGHCAKYIGCDLGGDVDLVIRPGEP